ncbi:MAG: AmmeMemoRadiSam system protein B, partial [Spirochaetes bacterium]|nr:AmmeMemoRadiSam system protein B [Spirochaetota bacterium]
EVQTVPFLQDNTIEVLLPLVHYFFGNISILTIYLPPTMKIIPFIDKLNQQLGRDTVYIGSTDLTHYGPNYGFYHKDSTKDAVQWVKEENDKGYLDLVVQMEEEKSLKYALTNKAACSAGAALGAMHAGKINGATKGNLIGYYTSYDIHQSSSFVGYGGVIF